jgi:hypothetical protein
MVEACPLQAATSKSLHLLQMTTCSTHELATLTFSSLELKSTFKLLRLEMKSLQVDSSEDNSSFFLISRARDFEH